MKNESDPIRTILLRTSAVHDSHIGTTAHRYEHPASHARVKGSAYVIVATIASFGGVELRGQAALPIDGPPAPVPPEVITRAASGQATVRAIKLTSPLKVDGQLDEEVYAREKPFGG